MNCYELLLFLCLFKFITTNEGPRVIIIGSGPSGIAAASRLLENDFNNVIILEAENRYGGRINTTKIGDYLADLGGQWIDGEEGNVARELALPLGLLSRSQYPGGPEALPPKLTFYDSSGYRIPDGTMAGLVELAGEATDEMPADFESLKNVSYGEFIENKYYNFFKEHPEFNEDFKESFLKNMEITMMGSETAEDWHKLSLEGAKTYGECTGYHGVNWKERTYRTILEILMKKYPNPENELPVLNKTLFNKQVTRINYGGDGPVRVTTKDGSEYTADHVILTGSLGVLKAKHQEIFNPPLSQEKREAIERRGMGKHAKILMYFDDPWWEHEGNIFKNFMWTKEDRESIENNPEAKWMLGIAYGIAIDYKPKLYLLWMTGNYSTEMERIPDELFRNQTIWFLQKFLGKTHNITMPREIQRSFWNTNENFRGTYSYATLEAFNSDRGPRQLLEPIEHEHKPVLQFAGEATNPNRYATVHGAIETGWREADRLLEVYNRKKNAWKMVADLSK